MNLQPEEIRAIIDSVLAKQQIIALDISNRGSDWLNRLSDTTILLERFLSKNKTVVML
jgi:hypothetical protein